MNMEDRIDFLKNYLKELNELHPNEPEAISLLYKDKQEVARELEKYK